MESIPGSQRARTRLLETSLRDFQAPGASQEPADRLPEHKLRIDVNEAPLPVLYRYALTLIGLPAYGPGDKIAWSVPFRYEDDSCRLAHEKFGLCLYLRSARPDDEASARLREIAKKLKQSMRTVEELLNQIAPDIVQSGRVTLVNQHARLRSAYEYFRARTLGQRHSNTRADSSRVDEIVQEFGSKMQERLNSIHDMIAAISAYLSLLEHIFVLALPFENFDPSEDTLKEIIGARWGIKWDRIFRDDTRAQEYKRRLTEVIELWRNPYSHGGFEKGQSATLWLQVPGIGAVAAGMTKISGSPHISYVPPAEADTHKVFTLFDEMDSWLGEELPHAMAWILSGLDVQFDEVFRAQYKEAARLGEFKEFLDYRSHLQEMHDNMDY